MEMGILRFVISVGVPKITTKGNLDSPSMTFRHTFCGTIDYMAPEMIKNLPHDHRLDIWCLGVLLYEMVHGYAPFRGKSDQEKCLNISKNAPIEFDKSLSPECVELIKGILKPAPVDRLTMEQIFNHPWMKKFEKIYNISLQSYIEQQDEQIRLMHKIESDKQRVSPSSNSHTEKEASTKANTDASRSESQSGGSGHGTAKIITIIDNTSPLNIAGKKFSFDEKDKKQGSSASI